MGLSSGIESSPKLCCREIITPSTFFVGGRLTMLGKTFVFTDTDSGTLDFMEENSDLFPFSDFNAMAERCAKVLADACEDGSFSKAAADAADSPDNGGSLSAAAFNRFLASCGLATPEQQCITLFRGFSDSDSGVVTAEELINELSL